MTPTQPIPGTLLAAFQRFADLSCYWHRAHTPDSLAIQELQERQRLLVDIPELIKRNTAFADLVSTRMFDAVAKVHAEPPRIAKEPTQDTAGHIRADFEPREALEGKESQETASKEAWRMLEAGETVTGGDEWSNCGHKWWPVKSSIGTPLFSGFVGLCRRRVTPPSEATKAATEPPNWREVVARVHRYMSGDQTYDHGCMTEDSGPNCVTSSKLIAELLGEQP